MVKFGLMDKAQMPYPIFKALIYTFFIHWYMLKNDKLYNI